MCCCIDVGEKKHDPVETHSRVFEYVGGVRVTPFLFFYMYEYKNLVWRWMKGGWPL